MIERLEQTIKYMDNAASYLDAAVLVAVELIEDMSITYGRDKAASMLGLQKSTLCNILNGMIVVKPLTLLKYLKNAETVRQMELGI